jgi:hypothetical protein
MANIQISNNTDTGRHREGCHCEEVIKTDEAISKGDIARVETTSQGVVDEI